MRINFYDWETLGPGPFCCSTRNSSGNGTFWTQKIANSCHPIPGSHAWPLPARGWPGASHLQRALNEMFTCRWLGYAGIIPEVQNLGPWVALGGPCHDIWAEATRATVRSIGKGCGGTCEKILSDGGTALNTLVVCYCRWVRPNAQTHWFAH